MWGSIRRPTGRQCQRTQNRNRFGSSEWGGLRRLSGEIVERAGSISTQPSVGFTEKGKSGNRQIVSGETTCRLSRRWLRERTHGFSTKLKEKGSPHRKPRAKGNRQAQSGRVFLEGFTALDCAAKQSLFRSDLFPFDSKLSAHKKRSATETSAIISRPSARQGIARSRRQPECASSVVRLH